MSNTTKNTATKEEGKQTLVPKLRFPEFRGTEGWEVKPLGKAAQNLDNRRRPITSSDREAGDIPYYGASGIVDYVEGFIFDEDLLCVSEDGANLVARIYPIAFPISGKTWVNNHAHVLKFENACTQKFVEVYLNSIKLDDFITGMAQPKLNKAMLDKIPIPYPKIAEQQKIAECLSSLDELMAAQARKLEALKNQKKWLMQQLFPRKGETQPLLRFPEFQNSGEWVEQRLDKIANYENGKAHENDISENGRYIVVNSKFISTEGEVRKYSNEGFCIADAGDVLMVLSDVPNGRAIAKCYFAGADELYTVNQRICRIQPTKIVGKFLFYVLDRNSYFLDFDDGVKQTNLRKEDVVGFLVYAPPQFAEQQRIADCLTSLDELITAEAQQLETLKAHKKGLMQQLFPSPVEAEV